MSQRKRDSQQKVAEDDKLSYCYDDEFDEDLLPKPYLPPAGSQVVAGNRDHNPIVFLEFQSSGGRLLRDGSMSAPMSLGRLYFELRADIVPVASRNFVSLATGKNGYGADGVCYHFKGVRVHRIVRNVLFQSGDLLDERGLCSRSVYNNGSYFRDENYILRHTGPGCISYCSRGPDTNGSLFQICFTRNAELDGKHVVFGCLASNDSYDCLERINSYGTLHGEPLEEIRIADCGLIFPSEAFVT